MCVKFLPSFDQIPKTLPRQRTPRLPKDLPPSKSFITFFYLISLNSLSLPFPYSNKTRSLMPFSFIATLGFSPFMNVMKIKGSC